MTDIRENYLTFKLLEIFVNSKEFNATNLNEVIAQLEEILKKDEKIKVRFTELNKEVLYPGQIDEENRVRIERVKLLYNRLSKIK